MKYRKIVIVGATSFIAHNCARLWAEQGAESFTLVGRDVERTTSVGQDLRSRSSAEGFKVSCRQVGDFCSPGEVEDAVREICGDGIPDLVLIAQGSSAEANSELTASSGKLSASLALNGISPLLFAQAFANRMQDGDGQIVIVGSVAGDRGRASNYVYGAGKSMVDTFVQGMRHYMALNGRNLEVSLIKPGPTFSPMTAELVGSMKLADVRSVAEAIVAGVRRRKKVIYVPFKWRIIMLIIRLMPDFIFNRLKI